jgi:hypothetical protein
MILFFKKYDEIFLFCKFFYLRKNWEKKLPQKNHQFCKSLYFMFKKSYKSYYNQRFFLFFSCFFSEFVRYVGWLPSTRGLGQIWLQLREESRKVWELCDILATYYNLLFLKMAILISIFLLVWRNWTFCFFLSQKSF